ncbi:DUF397 domain-containing protein [Streptomyces sp. NPDC048606]|uniref:DUF397 domain-containing protein n=1 Tax=Streptomyces sp. NPDC048606 TaxID=3154726 RepID=UPI00341E1BA9
MSTTRPTLADLTQAGVTWRKSSASGANNECVEVGAAGSWAGIRDTKQAGRGPVIIVTADALDALVTAVSAGNL